MDDRRVGRIFREVRIRKAWRQRDLAGAAGVSQGLISRIELGRLGSLSLNRLRKVGDALDIRISLDAWWRSGEVDRRDLADPDRGRTALVARPFGTGRWPAPRLWRDLVPAARPDRNDAGHRPPGAARPARTYDVTVVVPPGNRLPGAASARSGPAQR